MTTININSPKSFNDTADSIEKGVILGMDNLAEFVNASLFWFLQGGKNDKAILQRLTDMGHNVRGIDAKRLNDYILAIIPHRLHYKDEAGNRHTIPQWGKKKRKAEYPTPNELGAFTSQWKDWRNFGKATEIKTAVWHGESEIDSLLSAFDRKKKRAFETGHHYEAQCIDALKKEVSEAWEALQRHLKTLNQGIEDQREGDVITAKIA